MIFQPELAALIINSRKTQTRRPVKRDLPSRYEVGKDYALQPGRGQKAIDRILVTAVEQQTLDQIDHQAALAEGFRSVEEFRDYWRALYKIPDGRPTPWETEVWVITFELYRPAPKVIHIKHRTRLLSEQDGTRIPTPDVEFEHDQGRDYGENDEGQYTALGRRALLREPEAVDPAEISTAWGARSAALMAHAHLETEAVYRGLRIAEKIKRAHELAAEKGADISGPLAEAERHADRALRQAEAA